MLKINLLSILVLASATAHPLEAVDVKNLMITASRSPTQSFQGRRMVVNWYGGESHVQEILVYYKSPGLWRQELISPTGEVERVTIQRDSQEWIYDPTGGTLIHYSSASLRTGSLDSKEIRNLLSENYTLKAKGREEVLNGLLSRVIELSPKLPGGPKRILWLDAQRGIVLKTKQLTANGSLVSETHFTELDLNAHPDDALFHPPEISKGQIVETIQRETVQGPNELEVKGFDDLPWMTKLPQGFVLDHVSLVPLKGDNSIHFRYVDGLSVLSFFISPRPIEADENSVPLAGVEHDDPTFSFSTPVGNILTWEGDGYYYLLVGDLEPSTLESIRTALSKNENRTSQLNTHR